MKILILKPSSLGDVVQALPVLRLLKRHWPDSEIFWWLDSSLTALLQGDPDLAGVVPFERKRWARPVHWPEMLQSIRWIRKQRFDLVIDLQCLARSAAFAWLASGKFLIGLDEPREGARGFYDVIVRRSSFHTHAIDWYLDIPRALGVPVHWDFEWMPARADIASAIDQKWQTKAGRWVVLQPGARWENKRWPVAYYAEVVRKLAATRPDMRFAVLGSAADNELGAAIAKAEPARCLDLTGKVSLPEMVEWIRVSDLVIANDTGPMHVAAALSKPLVAIFGPTEPRRTGPYGQIHNVLQANLPCVPCLDSHCSFERPLECLNQITPDIVLRRAVQELNENRARSRAV